MNRFFQLYGLLRNGLQRAWFPVNAWRIANVCDVVWHTNPLPHPYQFRLLLEFDPFVGARIMRVDDDGAYLSDYLDQTQRLDAFDPLLAEAFLSMLSISVQKAWRLPDDPFNQPQP